MLERRIAANGVGYYASPLLDAAGVLHAFSTRIGGVSAAPFDSLNLGNPNACAIQDDYDRIWENYLRLQAAAGCADGELCRVHQVHGCGVALAGGGAAFDVAVKADAIVSRDPRRVLSVRVADCVPILLATGDGRAVAAVHAGWRGVVAGVVGCALREMLRASDAASDKESAHVIAAIGPCIGPDAFEVGPEVVAEFARLFTNERHDGGAAGGGAQAATAGGGYARPSNGSDRSFLDLRRAVHRQLVDAGVAAERIDTTDRCTHRDAEEFFSHRREHGVTGRMAAIIAARAN